MNYGQNIRKIREENGDTQCSLADKLGVRQSMVAQIERGTRTVSMPLAAQIAEIYNVDIRELFLA